MKPVPMDRHPFSTRKQRVDDMTALALFDEVARYVTWVGNNPIITTKVVNQKDHGPILFETPKARAMSIMGCCVFMVITQGDWAWMLEVEDLEPVLRMAEEAFRNQTFEGAAIDVFNSSFIAKHLGMAEKREVTGLNGEPLYPDRDLSEEEVIEEMKRRGLPADLFNSGY